MLKKFTSHLGISWLTILFILPLPFLYTLNNGLRQVQVHSSLGILFGALAYVWMLTAIYIATKPKWIDRWVGLPSAYMIHGVIALLALFLAFFHKELDSSEGLIKWTGDFSFIIFLGLATYSLVFMAGWLTTRIPLLQSIKTFLEQLFKHELSVWLHRLNIIATALIFIHIQLIDYIVNISPFIILIWIYTIFVFGSYMWFHFRPNAHGVRANLLSNREIAPSIRELIIQLPTKSGLKFRPGDFAFISFPKISQMAEPHPFSLVKAPGKDGKLFFAIRGDGDFTKQLSLIPNNSLVRVDGGFGKYQSIINYFKPTQLILIGGGIGVVPLFSVVQGNPNIPASFFYTVKSQEQLLYQDKLLELQKRPNTNVYYQVGRFSKEQILESFSKNTKDYVFLIGGPISMGRYWQKVIQASGVDPDRIYFEEFSW
ncbi:iron reductase [Streptococcus pseudoporcinus]|uniref:Oxidoreductase, FAD-dependent n=1 Tax=Streptococcus pseudoporcinus LQ 940-04 TaxID=875093 RepID=G5KBU3_9STRE|nr:iron reductase [Streptococcus pseudoporcinus]EFR45337.1 oxidoreductase NAD-binding domain protein [Streptococcus pseudoporcinus SPIN 20026]EHI65353.1 oxidoreductase, FAD-dependent [Streptococcus pseudoporcinus LQ 940-04]VEF92943.1 ferric reductase [Streptococcus pseudoporcinus]